MSAQAGTAPRTSASLETRLRATARSEWIKFRSVRSGPAVLLATAVILPVTAWLLCAYYRNGWATMSLASKASFDPVFISLRKYLVFIMIELSRIAIARGICQLRADEAVDLRHVGQVKFIVDSNKLFHYRQPWIPLFKPIYHSADQIERFRALSSRRTWRAMPLPWLIRIRVVEPRIGLGLIRAGHAAASGSPVRLLIKAR